MSSLSEKSLDSWIGRGKSYEDTPLNIANEVTAQISLSTDSLQALLPGLKTITQVVEFPLPAQSQTTTLFKPESRFNKSPPNIALSALLKRDDWLVPALLTVEGLDHCVGQAVLDGHLFIALWGFADELHAPLKVLALWKFLSRAAAAQVAWKKAFNWFNHTAGIEPKVTARVSAILRDTSWDATIPALEDSLSVTDTSQFLADGYLNTSHINAMLYRLQDRIVEKGQRNGEAVLVASVDFSTNLSQTKYPQGAQFETKTFGNKVTKKPMHYHLVTVAHSPPTHWAALAIDMREKDVGVSWGDSLGWKQLQSLVKGIGHWLGHHFPYRRCTFSAYWVHGDQQDGVSCGIVALNMLKHTLLGKPPWTQDQCHYFRLLELCGLFEGAFPDLRGVRPVAAVLNEARTVDAVQNEDVTMKVPESMANKFSLWKPAEG